MFDTKRHTAIIKVFLSLFLLIHKNKQLIGVGACSTEWIFISSVCKRARLSFLPAQKEIYACTCACMFVSIHFFCTPRPVSIMSELSSSAHIPSCHCPRTGQSCQADHCSNCLLFHSPCLAQDSSWLLGLLWLSSEKPRLNTDAVGFTLQRVVTEVSLPQAEMSHFQTLMSLNEEDFIIWEESVRQ